MADGKFKMAVTAECDLTFPMGKCIHDLLRKTSKTNRACLGCDHMVVGFITTYICNQCLSPLTL